MKSEKKKQPILYMQVDNATAINKGFLFGNNKNFSVQELSHIWLRGTQMQGWQTSVLYVQLCNDLMIIKVRYT